MAKRTFPLPVARVARSTRHLGYLGLGATSHEPCFRSGLAECRLQYRPFRLFDVAAAGIHVQQTAKHCVATVTAEMPLNILALDAHGNLSTSIML